MDGFDSAATVSSSFWGRVFWIVGAVALFLVQAGCSGTSHAGEPGAGTSSGSRLKASWDVGSDGSRSFAGWFDSKLNTTCHFRVAGGVRACVPDDVYTTTQDELTKSLNLYGRDSYIDADCKTKNANAALLELQTCLGYRVIRVLPTPTNSSLAWGMCGLSDDVAAYFLLSPFDQSKTPIYDYGALNGGQCCYCAFFKIEGTSSIYNVEALTPDNIGLAGLVTSTIAIDN